MKTWHMVLVSQSLSTCFLDQVLNLFIWTLTLRSWFRELGQCDMMFCQKYKYYIRTNDLMLTFCGRDTESEARQTEKQHTNKSKSVKCLWREFDLDFFPKWTEKQGQKANKHKIDIKKILAPLRVLRFVLLKPWFANWRLGTNRLCEINLYWGSPRICNRASATELPFLKFFQVEPL